MSLLRPALRSIALCTGMAGALALGAAQVDAGERKAIAQAAMQLFADHCFSPFLTADKAKKVFAPSGIDYDFYDLDPFSSAAPSPAVVGAVTPGTDRRCEVSFAGDHAQGAALDAARALQSEGIVIPASLPAEYSTDATTTLLAARQLNPRRTAIVHVGTRQGPNDTETFMRVERLLPANDQN